MADMQIQILEAGGRIWQYVTARGLDRAANRGFIVSSKIAEALADEIRSDYPTAQVRVVPALRVVDDER